jgi:membrane-bound metal-dependent hydrolase YbcI (DUF457 family)
MNPWVILIGLIVHWVADFVLQTDWEAKNKSTNNLALTKHVLKYSFVWLILTIGIVYGTNDRSNDLLLLFAPITFVCHWITDYFTSRLNTRLWKNGKVHNFFVSIGFDQILHYLQLGLTYLLLTQN